LIVKQMKNEQTPRSAPEIWAITDSRPGNAVQARALAEAVARRAGGVAVEKPIALRRPFDLIPAALWAAIPPREGGWPFSGSPMAARALAALACGGHRLRASRCAHRRRHRTVERCAHGADPRPRHGRERLRPRDRPPP
jgi:hypothetical protein